MWHTTSFSNSWINQAPVSIEATPVAQPPTMAYFSNSWLPVVTDESRTKVAVPVVPESSFVKVNGQYWAMVPVSPQSLPPSTPVTEIKTGDIEEEISAQNLYKTELCRSFQETGNCRYGSKCQFAHGKQELRPVIRHPKYKTEVCKTFHTIGTCPYGKRCRFIHSRKVDAPNQTLQQPSPNFVNVTSNSSSWPSNSPQKELSPPMTQTQTQTIITPTLVPTMSSFQTPTPLPTIPPSFESDIANLLDSDDEDDSKGRLSFFQSLA